MASRDEFNALVQTWAQEWFDREADLEAHPELLSEEAELVILEPLIGFLGKPDQRDVVLSFLMPLAVWEAADGWLAAAAQTPQSSMEYLETHPQTLSDEAERFIEYWIKIQERNGLDQVAGVLRQRLELLRRSRSLGIAAAHEQMADTLSKKSPLPRILIFVGIGVLAVSALCCGVVVIASLLQ